MDTRDRIILELRTPRCAREIRERLGIGRKAAESALSRLAHGGVARCLTPQVRQSRLYGLSALGRLLLAEIDPAPGRLGAAEVPLDLYAWVQAGAYRRLVLRHLTEPLRSKQLRERINR